MVSYNKFVSKHDDDGDVLYTYTFKRASVSTCPTDCLTTVLFTIDSNG